MFLNFYQLCEQPFGVTADPRFLYPSRIHREALASLMYGIENDLGFSALIAEPGLGKTILLSYVLENFRNTALTAFVFETQCSSATLLSSLVKELNLDSETRDVGVLHERLQEALAATARAGRRVIVVIDEAQNLGPSVLETVRLLSNFETRRRKLLHIILSGQPQLARRLARPDMEQLHQRLSTISRLERLTPYETACYVDHRLRVAGYRGDPLFSDAALDRLAALSGGVPRNINRLCFNALTLGCAAGERRISRETMEAACDSGVRWLVAAGTAPCSVTGPSGYETSNPVQRAAPLEAAEREQVRRSSEEETERPPVAPVGGSPARRMVLTALCISILLGAALSWSGVAEVLWSNVKELGMTLLH